MITEVFPEDNYNTYTYDARGNVLSIVRTPKSGSGLGATTVSAGYPGTVTCPSSDPKIINKPCWTRDALNNQTDYTYDPAHGGILTEMKPAVTIGTPGSTVTARPLTVTTWTQRYAWLKSASGGLDQSLDPVWMIATVTECQTSPGSSTPVCSASAQTVTTYEYGANGTRESPLVKGVAVTANGTTRRTCFGYDPFNRRISETKPNADPGVCP